MNNQMTQLDMVTGGVLVALLVSAVVADFRSRRIPNVITVPVIAGALLVHGFSGGAAGMVMSVGGLFAGLGLMWIPYMAGGMGGGDVKLMGAVGALMGAGFAWQAFLFAAVAGGVMGLVYAAAHGRLREAFRGVRYILMGILYKTDISGARERADDRGAAFPYAGAIAIGAGVAWFASPWFARVAG